MVTFHKVSIADKPWCDALLALENSRSADFNFGNIFMWDHAYRQYLTSCGERLLTKLKYDELPFFAFPVGRGELKPAIDELTEFAARRGYPLRIRGITEGNRALMEGAYPGRFQFTEDRDNFDYIYSIERMSDYAGKKLHGKRNHCNRFEAEHSWRFERLTTRVIPLCMEMLGEWQNEFEMPPEGLTDEHAAIIRGFMHYERLGLEGGILYAEDKPVGFTVGEKTSGDTFDVHFEKAYASINGAYPMVCREFARQIRADHPEIVYLNREDDMGHENLRKAKLDFSPEFLLEKYTAMEK